jgi:tetratricopeptide (TPR) repeat protein
LVSLVVLALVLAAFTLGPVALLLLIAAAFVPILAKLAQGSADDAIRLFLRRPDRPTKLLREIKRVGEREVWDLGARRSILAERVAESDSPPYARFREIDNALDTILEDPKTQMVLIHGHAGAGKSRMLAEAIRRHFGDSYLVVPDPSQKDAIAELMDRAAWFRGGSKTVVVWLDRLEAYLEAGVLTSDLVERSAETTPRFLLVATIRSEPLDALLSTAGDPIPGLDQDLARKLLMPDGHAELRSLKISEATALDPMDPTGEIYADLELSRGLGLALSQREVYVHAYRDRNLDPLARALVQAAVDLRRVGLEGPFSEARLIEIASDYPVGGALRDAAAVRDALVVANAPLGGLEDLRLLIAVDGRWTVDDLLLDIDSGRAGIERREIPESMWAITTENLSTAEVVAMASWAERRGASPVTGEELWRRVLASGDSAYAAQAMYSLGVRFDEQDRLDAAAQIWEDAAESGHEEFAAAALFNLGCLYFQKGEIDEAIDACRRAIATGHPHHAPRSMWNLGTILLRSGNPEEGLEILEQAAGTPHIDVASKSSYRLGELYAGRGQLEEARNAYLRVVECQQYGYEVSAMNQLVDLCEQTKRFDEAEAWRRMADRVSSQMDYGFY